jgi:hypothetical protein
MTFSIITFSIVSLSIKGILVTLCINLTEHKTLWNVTAFRGLALVIIIVDNSANGYSCIA